MNTNNALEKIEECKVLINALSKVQDKIYDNLVNSLQLDDKLEDHLFDYLYNGRHDNFEQALKQYGILRPLFKHE